MQCIDCNDNVCLSLVPKERYVCRQNHRQKHGNRCEICGDSNLLLLNESDNFCACEKSLYVVTSHESASHSSDNTEIKSGIESEIAAQRNALLRVMEDILEIVKCYQCKAFADKAYSEMGNCLNQLLKLLRMHENILDFQTSSFHDVSTQTREKIDTENAQSLSTSHEITREQQTQTLSKFDISLKEVEIQVDTLKISSDESVNKIEEKHIEIFTINENISSKEIGIQTNTLKELSEQSLSTAKNIEQKEVTLSINEEISFNSKEASVQTNTLKQLSEESLSTLKNIEQKEVTLSINEEISLKSKEASVQTNTLKQLSDKSISTVMTREQNTQTYIEKTEEIPQISRDLDYKVMTVAGAPVAEVSAMSKAKNFDQRMHALYNAYRECPFDLPQTNYIDLKRYRDMHIPTAPLEETVAEDISVHSEESVEKWKDVKLKQRLHVRARHMNNNEELLAKSKDTFFDCQSELEDFKKWLLSQKSNDNAKNNAENNIACEKSKEDVTLSKEQAAHNFLDSLSKEMQLHIHETLKDEADTLEWKFLTKQKLSKEQLQETDVESIYDSECVLKNQQLASSETIIKKGLRKLLREVDRTSYTAEETVIRAVSNDLLLRKSSSKKALHVKKNSVLDWPICHIPKVWRVLYNAQRTIFCPLHTTVQACRCDFKAYGHSPMIQPVVNVPLAHNYRQSCGKVYNYEELTMLHAPVNCPDALCHRKYLIPDCCHHFISQHEKLPVYNIYPGERIDFDLHPCPAQENCNRSQVLFLVRNKIKGVGRNQYSDRLPLILMTARVKLASLAHMKLSEASKMSKRNEDYLLVWICGLSALELKTSYTFTTWRYKDNIPLCHLSHSANIINIRNNKTPFKIYESGKALLISPHELYILSGAHRDFLQCQVVVH